MKGDLDRARELACRALAVSKAGGWPVAVGYAECALARVALASGKLHDAEAAARGALATHVSVDARVQVARTHVLLGEILAAALGLRLPAPLDDP